MKYRGERDFVGAEQAFDRAEALGAINDWGRGLFLIHLGRFEDAIEAYDRAVRRDPLSSVVQAQRGTAYFCAGRFHDAAEHLETAIEMGAANHTDGLLAAAYLKAGRRQRALEQIQELRNSDVDPAFLAYVYASVDSIEVARRFHEADPPDFRTASRVSLAAAAHVLLDGPEAALDYLEEVEQDEPRRLDGLDCFEEVRSLRTEARYQELLTRLGHPGRGLASEN